MAKQVIGIGSAYDDPSADKIRDGFDKANDNFTELYNLNTDFIFKEVIAIGAWNMDSTQLVTVDWTLPASHAIINMQAVIINDSGAYYDFGAWQEGGVGSTSIYHNGTTQFTLSSKAAGLFDSALFNDAVMNRGYITVEYIAI